MLCRALVAIALVCAIPSAYSYSSGAPDGACGDMTPQHHVAPQASEPPYKLLLSKSKLGSGSDESINVKIQGNGAGDTIKGFMIQGRIGDKPVGKFQLPPKPKHVQLLNCSGGSGNALTHKKIFGNGPTSVEAVWIRPPGITGEVKFFATVALNGGIFWVGQLNEKLTLE